jgi:KUP system potassium uptake protein
VTTPHARSHTPFLVLAALGVVYGDIGTSPLYALRECFAGSHAIPVSAANVLGVLSLILWSLIITVSVKYLLFVMRADNGGEGGILALVALVRAKLDGISHTALIAIGLFGAALLYGDGMITPAISVLSAVEGLTVATNVFQPVVVPITIAILIVLFAMQRRGTGKIGTVFGPIMVLWFVTIAGLGLPAIWHNPIVLAAASPLHGLEFLVDHGFASLGTLGAVFLSVTGAEALYADMGHFGARPIRIAWFSLVLPALVINYFGQGALILVDPMSIEYPFFHLAPEWALYPLVALAASAAVIASQAVISGAFSLTQQATQLGYSPRVDIQHTSADVIGQIYIPQINWILMVATVGLVLGFKSSTNLAAAYGMAVTTTMVITTILAYVVTRHRWGWSTTRASLVAGGFLIVDVAFLAANVIKIEHGGWFPLLVGAAIYAIMTTWHEGRKLVVRRLAEDEVTLPEFFETIRKDPPVRVPGTAIFMTARAEGVPPILIHHLTHNQVLHEQVVLLTVTTENVPSVDPEASLEVEQCGMGVWRVTARFGFMQTPNVPQALERTREHGLYCDPADTTYYLAQLTLLSVPSVRLGMAWRDSLFIFLSRNARRATSFYRVPPDRVIEIGMQMEI